VLQGSRAKSPIPIFPQATASALTARGQYRFGEFTLDPEGYSLRCGDQVVPIPPKVLETLLLLVEHRDRIVTKEEIFETVWPNTTVEESNLTQNIFLLRKALKQNAKERFIMTFPGRGYRFVAHVDEIQAGDLERPSVPPLAAPQFPVNRYSIVTAMLLLALGACAAVLYLDRQRNSESKGLHRSFFTTMPGSAVQPAWSPDGKRVAFSWNGENAGAYNIFVKSQGSETPVRLTEGPGDDTSPTWSPDGTQIAFIRLRGAESGVYVTPSQGSAVRRVTQLFGGRRAIQGRHLDWSPDGRYFAVNDKASPEDILSLYLISVADGRRSRLTSPTGGLVSDIAPRFSRDSRQLAFIRSSSYRTRDIYLAEVSSGKTRRITNEGKWLGDLDWSEDSRDLIFSGDRSGLPELWRVRVSSGKIAQVPAVGENSVYVSVARSEHRLLYTQAVSDTNIWRFTLPSPQAPHGAWATLFASTRNEYGAQYSPDGRQIAFCSDRTDSRRQIWIGDPNTNTARPLSITPAGVASFDWSPDGKQFAYYTRTGEDFDIFIVPATGGTATRLTGPGSDDQLPKWSPDGRFIYYSSNRSGDWQIWRMHPDGSGVERITKGGGYAARPSRDGKYLYFARGLTVPGIWRTPASGGDEIRIADFPKAEFWAAWTVTDGGIYWLDGPAPGVPPAPSLRFFDFATGKVTQVGVPDNYSLFYNEYNLNVSPDGRNLLLAYQQGSGSNIVQVQGFH